MDNSKQKNKDTLKVISLKEDWEVSWWTQKLGVSWQQLQEAINKVGNSVDHVTEFLSKK